MGVQHRLDLPDFHPVPPHFDHAITAAQVLVVTAVKEGNAVTGAVRPAIPPRLSPVTEHHGRTVNHQLAFLAGPGQSPVGTLGPYPVPGARPSDRHRTNLTRRDALDLIERAHVGLRRTVQIENAHGKMVTERPEILN